jgi:acyl-CoA reductase-like NAD-dependent aldehyde dehydrogenase
MTEFAGYFLQLIVIKTMSGEMITTREETFAPVVGLCEFSTEEEAIGMANDCDVGLGSFIITESIPRPSECLRKPIWWGQGKLICERRLPGYRGVFGGQVDAY